MMRSVPGLTIKECRAVVKCSSEAAHTLPQEKGPGLSPEAKSREETPQEGKTLRRGAPEPTPEGAPRARAIPDLSWRGQGDRNRIQLATHNGIV
jgi:hypothetical protein